MIFFHYNHDADYESGEDDTEFWGVDHLNISESGDDGISDLNIWCKRLIRRQPKYIHDMHYNNYVNDMVEWNLLHEILNTSKYVKVKRYH